MPRAYVTGDPGDVANLDQPDYSNDPVIPYDEDQRITSMESPAPIVPPPPPQPAPAAPAPAPPATPNLILRGPQGPPPAVSGPPVQMMSPEQAANDFMWRRLSNTVRDLPLAETEQAVSAALRYQGQRQYQQDLASGMSPSEALAKSAPLIFSGPKQGTLGQAASMVKATRPAVPAVRNVGGVLYRFNPDGSATPLTPPKPPPTTLRSAGGVLYKVDKDGNAIPLTPARPPKQQLSEPDKALLAADVTELKGIEKQLGSTEEHGFGVMHPFGGNKAQMDALRKKASDLRQKIQTDYGSKSRTGTSQPVPPKEKRVAGQVYQTPKGPHLWTGTGWKVPPQPVTAAEPAATETTDEGDENAE